RRRGRPQVFARRLLPAVPRARAALRKRQNRTPALRFLGRVPALPRPVPRRPSALLERGTGMNATATPEPPGDLLQTLLDSDRTTGGRPKLPPGGRENALALQRRALVE